jgi:hypothetical protein
VFFKLILSLSGEVLLVVQLLLHILKLLSELVVGSDVLILEFLEMGIAWYQFLDHF